MKTILPLLLFPIFLFSQQLDPTENDLFEMEQFIDYYMESMHVNELDLPYHLDVTIEVIVSVEVYYEELIYEPMWPEMINMDHPVVSLPKYLSAVSLANLLPKENDRFEEQLRWNRELAINNPISSTDSVLEKLLRPSVNFDDKLAWIENRQVGFGPRVRI
jgi:hypothetical protein